MSKPSQDTAKNSEISMPDILNQIEALRSLSFALITAIECQLYTDCENEDLPIKGAEHFVVDQKILLETFGAALNDNFNILTSLVERHENNHE